MFWINPCNHHLKQQREHFHHLRKFPLFLCYQFTLVPGATFFWFCHLDTCCLFLDFIRVELSSTCDLSLILLSVMIWRISHVVLWLGSLLCSLTERYFIVWLHHNVFIHPLIHGHLGPFQVRAIMNKVTLNILEQVSALCGHHMFSFLLGEHLRIELLGHSVKACLTLLETWWMYLKYSIYKGNTKTYNCCAIPEWSMNLGSIKAALSPAVLLAHLKLLVYHLSQTMPCSMTCCSVSVWLHLSVSSLCVSLQGTCSGWLLLSFIFSMFLKDLT